MTDYPKSFPFDAVSMMTAAFKAGDFSDVEGLARAGWNVQGFAMANLIGDGAPNLVGGAAPAPRMTRKKAVDELEKFVRENEAAGGKVRIRRGAAPGTVGAFPIPWTVLLQLGIELVQKLLQKKSG